MDNNIDIEKIIEREHTEAYLQQTVVHGYRAWYERRQRHIRNARATLALVALGVVATFAIWLAQRPIEGTMVAEGGVTVTCSDGDAAADMLARTERIYALI